MSTVHPPPPASKSYRDAAVCGSPPAKDQASSPTETLLVPSLTPSQVEVLQQQFPERVTISAEKFAASTAAWSNALIGKCLGRDVPSDSMLAALSPLWSSIGEWELFPMANGFFVFRFSSPEARDEVLFGGPWIVDGAVLALSPFDPVFRPSTDHIVRAILWVRLPELPPGFWSDEIITDILSVVGRVVRLDDHTRLRTRGRFARAAVEVDLRQPLRPGITVDVENGSLQPFWQSFQYEHVHMFCLRCRCVGHKLQSCGISPDLSSSTAHPPGGDLDMMTATAFPSSWTASLMVRRHRRAATAGDGAAGRQRHREMVSRAPPIHSPSQRQSSPLSSPMPSVGPLHVGGHVSGAASKAPETSILVGPLHVGGHVGGHGSGLGGASISLASSCGPATSSGPASGPLSPSLLTSAIGPKPTELSNSGPSPLASAGLAVAGNGFGGTSAMDEECDDEDRIIQEIMLADADDDDEFDYTVAGKKKKSGKGKLKEICLRLEPRNRVLKKKVKFGGNFGSFSLLRDLAGDATSQELMERYGPPPEGLV